MGQWPDPQTSLKKTLNDPTSRVTVVSLYVVVVLWSVVFIKRLIKKGVCCFHRTRL